MARAARVLTDANWFGEGPRWHDGRLWFGDWAELAVRSITPDGTLRTELAVGDSSRPSEHGSGRRTATSCFTSPWNSSRCAAWRPTER